MEYLRAQSHITYTETGREREEIRVGKHEDALFYGNTKVLYGKKQ